MKLLDEAGTQLIINKIKQLSVQEVHSEVTASTAGLVEVNLSGIANRSCVFDVYINGLRIPKSADGMGDIQKYTTTNSNGNVVISFAKELIAGDTIDVVITFLIA